MNARICTLIVVAITTLGLLGLAQEPVEQGKTLSQWIELMTAADPAVRQEACLAMANMRTRAAPGVPALAKALRDPDTGVRYSAAFALFFMGKAARNALPELEAALKDSEAGVREMAAMALADSNIGAARSLPALQAALSDPDASVRLYAQNAIKSIQAATGEAGNQPRISGTAVQSPPSHAAAPMPDTRAPSSTPPAQEPVENGKTLSEWMALMNSDQSAVRREACNAIGNLRDKAAPAVSVLARASVIRTGTCAIAPLTLSTSWGKRPEMP